MAQDNLRPVIIKRKKIVGGDGHHGGAWKVAYADFVTAMMAFFMLMWLLNATTETQRKGIADYFSPTIPVHRISGGGQGALAGQSVTSEDTLAHDGTGASAANPTALNRARGEVARDETAALEAIAAQLAADSGESAVADSLREHIRTRVTDEGLIVELFDLPGSPLFGPGTTTPRPVLEALSGMLAELFAMVSNEVAVAGHIRAHPVVLAENPVWDLSTRRAQAMRLQLSADGLDAERVQRVTGWADRRPTEPDRMDVRNNRLEITLLRSGTGPR